MPMTQNTFAVELGIAQLDIPTYGEFRAYRAQGLSRTIALRLAQQDKARLAELVARVRTFDADGREVK
jgi:hypothetical protein